MIWDGQCKECGCKQLDKSRQNTHGEVTCSDCGTIVEDFVVDSSPAPIWEGDDNRPGGPIRKVAPGSEFDPTPRGGDILRNVPAGKKKAICHDQNGGCGNSQLIDKFDDECNNCGASVWKYKQNIQSMPIGKIPDWIFKRQAKQFLQLGRNDGEEDVSEDIKGLNIGATWIDLVTDVISNPGLPERSPEGEQDV